MISLARRPNGKNRRNKPCVCLRCGTPFLGSRKNQKWGYGCQPEAEREVNRIYARERARHYPTARRAHSRVYYEGHREYYREYQRRWRQEHCYRPCQVCGVKYYRDKAAPYTCAKCKIAPRIEIKCWV